MQEFDNVIAFVSGQPSDKGVLAAAIGVARPSHGHVEIIFINPAASYAAADAANGAPVGYGGWADSGSVPDCDHEQSARRTFDEIAGGLPAVGRASVGHKLTVNFRAVRGRVEDAAARAGLYTDLCVSAQPVGRNDARQWQIAETLLIESGRPVLLVPPDYRMTPKISRIMIAWSKAPPTVRAIHEALPLLTRASGVDVVGIGQDHEPSEIAEWLRGRDIPANAIFVQEPQEQTAEILIRLMAERGAQLLVLGGYSRSRLREVVFGGVTRQLLRESVLPVFVCH